MNPVCPLTIKLFLLTFNPDPFIEMIHKYVHNNSIMVYYKIDKEALVCMYVYLLFLNKKKNC